MSGLQRRRNRYTLLSNRWHFKTAHSCEFSFYMHGSYSACVKEPQGEMVQYHLKKNDAIILQGDCWQKDEALEIIEDKLVELGLLYRPKTEVA